MEIGLALSNIRRHLTREATVTLARAAEDLGVDSVCTSEHLVVTSELFDPFGQIFDSLTTLTYVAAVTDRVRLGTSVLILPLHEPVLLAKQAATLHALSGGRLRLGVGVGWLAGEFAIAGADFEGLVATMDHHLAVLRHLLRPSSALRPASSALRPSPSTSRCRSWWVATLHQPYVVRLDGATAGTASGSSPRRCLVTSRPRAGGAGGPTSGSASASSSGCCRTAPAGTAPED